MIVGFFCALCTLVFLSPLAAQESSETKPCTTPYVKLIKPKAGKTGEQIVIRGRRFGKQRHSGEVIFPPGVNGTIIDWKNSRITVKVPLEAETGRVVVKTVCATSNGEFFTVER